MKTVEEIYGEMLACFEGETGLEAKQGTDLSARLYAVAAQVYTLYVQSEWVVRQAFPQSAEGEYLDRHAQLRSITRKSAVPARGVIRFIAEEPSVVLREIPQGTVCMTANLVRFATTQSAVLPPEQLTVDVPILALEPGEAGNVASEAIVSMAVAPMGIAKCTNPQPCTGGADQEGDEALRVRILDTFQRLPNGANAAFYEQGALSFDQVVAAAVIPRPRGVGTVDVIPATRSGTPDEKLLNDLKAYFEERREIAVEVQVKAPRTMSVDLTVKVRAKGGWVGEQVRKGVEDRLRSWFDGSRLGKDILLAQLGSLIYSCEGVENYAIITPSSDTSVETDVLPRLGSLRVEAMA